MKKALLAVGRFLKIFFALPPPGMMHMEAEARRRRNCCPHCKD